MKHGLTPPVCLPFVHLMSLHVTRSPRPSPAVFAYCKRSNTGSGNGLGTRLDIFYDHVCKPWIRYICSNLLEYVRQSPMRVLKITASIASHLVVLMGPTPCQAQQFDPLLFFIHSRHLQSSGCCCGCTCSIVGLNL